MYFSVEVLDAIDNPVTTHNCVLNDDFQSHENSTIDLIPLVSSSADELYQTIEEQFVILRPVTYSSKHFV